MSECWWLIKSEVVFFNCSLLMCDQMNLYIWSIELLLWCDCIWILKLRFKKKSSISNNTRIDQHIYWYMGQECEVCVAMPELRLEVGSEYGANLSYIRIIYFFQNNLKHYIILNSINLYTVPFPKIHFTTKYSRYLIRLCSAPSLTWKRSLWIFMHII